MPDLEHVNITVPDADALAETLCGLFDWRVRWSGDGMGGAGRTVHVGSASSYLALYTPGAAPTPLATDTHQTERAINHIGVLVEDLDAVEMRVKAAGFETFNHADYEPGRRFYFDGPQGIEIEVISYA